MTENMILTSYSDKVVLCRKLTWIGRKATDDVERQTETPGKSIIFVAQQIYLIARYNFHVALEVGYTMIARL